MVAAVIQVAEDLWSEVWKRDGRVVEHLMHLMQHLGGQEGV